MQANNSFQDRISSIQSYTNQWEKLANLKGNQKIAVDPVKGELVVSDEKGIFTATDGTTRSIELLKTDAKFTSVWLKTFQARTRGEIESFEIALVNSRNPKEHLAGLEALNSLRRQIENTEKKYAGIVALYQGENEIQENVKLQEEALKNIRETTIKNVFLNTGRLIQLQKAKSNPTTETVLNLSKEVLDTRQKANVKAKEADIKFPQSTGTKLFHTKVEDAGPEAKKGTHELLAVPPRLTNDGTNIPHQFVEDYHRLREVRLNGNIVHTLREKNINLTKEQLALEGFKRLEAITSNRTAAQRLAVLMTQTQSVGISTKIDSFFRQLRYDMTQFMGLHESIDIKEDKIYITIKVTGYGRNVEQPDLVSDALMGKRVVSIKLAELADPAAKSFPSLTVTDFISSPIATKEYAEDLLKEF